MWPGMVVQQVPGHGAEDQGVGDPVGHRIEERAPHARPARRLGQGPVEQVRHRRTR